MISVYIKYIFSLPTSIMLHLYDILSRFSCKIDTCCDKFLDFFLLVFDIIYSTRPRQFVVHYILFLLIFYTNDDIFIGEKSFRVFPGYSVIIRSPHNPCISPLFCFFHYAYDTVILWIFLLIFNVVSFAIVHFVIYLWDSPSQLTPHHLPYTPPSQRLYISTRLQIPPTPCSSPSSPYLSPISSPRRHIRKSHKSTRSTVRPRHLPPPTI